MVRSGDWRLALVAAVWGMAGCSMTTANVTPVTGAPQRAPVARAEVVHTRPAPPAVELARVEVEGNAYTSAADCEARLATESAKVGGDIVFAETSEGGGVVSHGKCTGIAFATK